MSIEREKLEKLKTDLIEKVLDETSHVCDKELDDNIEKVLEELMNNFIRENTYVFNL